MLSTKTKGQTIFKWDVLTTKTIFNKKKYNTVMHNVAAKLKLQNKKCNFKPVDGIVYKSKGQ